MSNHKTGVELDQMDLLWRFLSFLTVENEQKREIIGMTAGGVVDHIKKVVTKYDDTPLSIGDEAEFLNQAVLTFVLDRTWWYAKKAIFWNPEVFSEEQLELLCDIRDLIGLMLEQESRLYSIASVSEGFESSGTFLWRMLSKMSNKLLSGQRTTSLWSNSLFEQLIHDSL